MILGDYKLKAYNLLLVIVFILTVTISLLFEGAKFYSIFTDYFNLLMIGLFSFIYIILALNEVSVIENGYEKRYRFTLSILLVSLLSLGGYCTIAVCIIGNLLYLFLNSLREGGKKLQEAIFSFCSTTIPISIACLIFDLSGGKSGEVKFPGNIILVIAAGIIEYIVHSSIMVLLMHINSSSKDKNFFRLFYREYGWILKYDLWQAIYAIMFYNTAALYIYNNWNRLQSGVTEITSTDFVYFITWLFFVSIIFYIPIRNWLASFNTFILYNRENVKNVINDMDEGILILDNFNKIKNHNPSVMRMFEDIYQFDAGKDYPDFLNVISTYSKEPEKIVEIKAENSVKTEISLHIPELKYYNLTMTPEVNRFGEITGNVVTIDDVTKYRTLIDEINSKNIILDEYRVELENRLNELQKTQEQLIISEKMAVIGHLVAGVAHEINTPLASIKSNVDLLDMMMGMMNIDDKEMLENFKENAVSMNNISKMALERIIEVVKNLKNFARLDEADKKEVDIREGIDSTLLLLRSQMGVKISIVKEYYEVPKIICYPQQLNQVLLNLLVNAYQAIESEGVITIKTVCQNDKIIISIKDTGKGISQENIKKIFDPGYTTKGVGVGTGLGLSISYKIIEKHKGQILVKSQEGIGTEMSIVLPLSQ